MNAFSDAIQIINTLTDWILNTSIPITQSVSIPLIYLIMFIIIVGAVIYALANKEA